MKHFGLSFFARTTHARFNPLTDNARLLGTNGQKLRGVLDLEIQRPD